MRSFNPSPSKSAARKSEMNGSMGNVSGPEKPKKRSLVGAGAGAAPTAPAAGAAPAVIRNPLRQSESRTSRKRFIGVSADRLFMRARAKMAAARGFDQDYS